MQKLTLTSMKIIIVTSLRIIYINGNNEARSNPSITWHTYPCTSSHESGSPKKRDLTDHDF